MVLRKHFTRAGLAFGLLSVGPLWAEDSPTPAPVIVPVVAAAPALPPPDTAASKDAAECEARHAAFVRRSILFQKRLLDRAKSAARTESEKLAELHKSRVDKRQARPIFVPARWLFPNARQREEAVQTQESAVKAANAHLTALESTSFAPAPLPVPIGIGAMGALDESCTVYQVLDGRNALVRIAGNGGALVWVAGSDTAGMVDAQPYKLHGVYEAASCRTFTTPLGYPTTVTELRAVDEARLEAMARAALEDANARTAWRSTE